MENNIKGLDIAKKAAQVLADTKGIEIKLLDVRNLSSVTDYYLIVSGSSPPHLKAMFREIQFVMKKEGTLVFRKAGDPAGGWLVIDYIDVIIHIFLPESRKYYAIEELWAEAPVLKLPDQ